MNLTGNTILITGGTSGIGLEFARQLLARNNTVIITGRDATRLANARQLLPGVHCIQSNVADADATTTLYRTVTAEFPALNIVINNAGVMRKIDVQDASFDLSTIGREIDVNLVGTMRMVQQFVPHLSTQRHAAIINISSGLAFVPFAIAPIYCATKAALHSYTQSIRLQLKGSPIAVIEVAPPFTVSSIGDGEFTSGDVGGVKAMPVSAMVQRALTDMERGKEEITPGLSRMLRLLSRLAPTFAAGQLGKSVELMHQARA